jgi:hypothetical protein
MYTQDEINDAYSLMGLASAEERERLNRLAQLAEEPGPLQTSVFIRITAQTPQPEGRSQDA